MTYVVLSLAVLAIVAAVTVPTLRRLRARPILLTGLVLIALTAVFDNLIVGLGIVAYEPDKISGLRLLHAPIEDFAYSLGAIMLVPALWTWLARPSHPSGPSSPSTVRDTQDSSTPPTGPSRDTQDS